MSVSPRMVPLPSLPQLLKAIVYLPSCRPSFLRARAPESKVLFYSMTPKQAVPLKGLPGGRRLLPSTMSDDDDGGLAQMEADQDEKDVSHISDAQI